MRKILSPWLCACFVALVLMLAILLIGSLAPSIAAAAPPAQGKVVVNAVDNDADNRLWNCETNRVPFGNTETDRSRCFSFRYQVPREGIKSAMVYISLSTLGADQDTDATIVAVSKPYAPCAWGQGKMPGCVGLHGGFIGAHKSLTLNLLDIACDKSVQNTPEAQQLVRDQLQTGVLHMLLQDDTAVYSAQLVLNDPSATVACGASATSVPTLTAGTSQPPRASTPTPIEIGAAVNTLLTGTASPHPPHRDAVATAAVAGVGALGAFAFVNSLLSRLATGGLTLPAGKTPEGLPSRTPLTKGSGAGGASSKPTTTPEEQPPRSPIGTAKAKPGDLPEGKAEARAGQPAERIAEASAGRPAEGIAEASAGQPEAIADARAGRPAEGIAEARAGRPAEGIAEARAGRPAEGIAEARPGQPIEVEAKLREEAESKLQEGLDKLKDKVEEMAEPSEWKCHKCGRKNRVEHRFCVKCGTRRGQGG